jgi:4-hydroxyisophthalate hydroxylase
VVRHGDRAGRPSGAGLDRAGRGAGTDVLEAEYVVGCDGARSVVRDQVGIERGGTNFEQLMVLAVFRSRALHERLKRFPARSTYRVIIRT